MHRAFSLLFPIMLALSFAVPTLAYQQSPTVAYPKFEGELLKAERQFDLSKPSLFSTSSYSFVVSSFNSYENAVIATEQTLANWQAWESPSQFTSFEIIESGPSLYEQSTWFVASGSANNTQFELAGVIFRDDSFVHQWVALGVTGSMLSDLQAITESFVVQIPPKLSEESLLTMIPSLRDMPTGFVMTSEEVSLGDFYRQ